MSDPIHHEGHLVLVRHGETQWSRDHRHTGRTDLDLLPEGEQAARALARTLAAYDFRRVLTSPLRRASRTAELAGLTAEADERLLEWDYGAYEGLTTVQIREHAGEQWTVFDDGVRPGDTPGESIGQVADRAGSLLADLREDLAVGPVCLVAHGHLLRVLAAIHLEADPRFAARLPLQAGSVSVLAPEKGRAAILHWNLSTARDVAAESKASPELTGARVGIH